MLSTLGPGGWETLRERPERIREVTADVEALGLKVHAQYALMGQYDYMVILDCPDEKTVMLILTREASGGNVRYETMPAMPMKEFAALVQY